MRVFEAPRNFVGNLKRISKVHLTVVCLYTYKTRNSRVFVVMFPFSIPIPQASDELPLGATVPSLGLSNKAIFKTAEAEGGRSSEQSGGAKNAFGDNVPTFVSVDLESKCSVDKSNRLRTRESQIVYFY